MAMNMWHDDLDLVRRRPEFDPCPAAGCRNRRDCEATTHDARAVALLVPAVAGSWFAFRQTDDTRPAGPPTAQTATQVASLDLRPLAVTRPDEQKVAAAPLEMPRGRVNATILLPVGSSTGAYELRILDGDLRVRAGARRRRSSGMELHARCPVRVG
jgi:hypothetical protein